MTDRIVETDKESVEGDNSGGKIEFIVHVGAGKTGTSSIQQTLLRNTDELRLQNIKYLGLMLEHAFKKYYDWQYASKIVDYYALDFKIANKQLCNVLTETIHEAKSNGIHKIIWSNESLLGKDHYFVKALEEVTEKNDINLKIIVYVRNYLNWSLSAYKQWGIKHKTYEGPVQKFSEWIGHKSPYFYKMIEPLYYQFPNSIFVRNMDAVVDVVEDFCDICGIDASNFSFVRGNDSPEYEELYLRCIYNDQFRETVLPYRYDKTIGKLAQLEQPVDTVISEMLPTISDLEKINKMTGDDQKQINSLLREQGQQVLDNTIPEKMNSEGVDLSKFVNGLSELVIKQSIKIENLEKEIVNLKEVFNS